MILIDTGYLVALLDVRDELYTRAVLMAQRRIERALAFDRHFEQAGFVPLLRMEPVGS